MDNKDSKDLNEQYSTRESLIVKNEDNINNSQSSGRVESERLMSVKLIKALGGQELKRAKDFCRKWQYFSTEDQVYFDHSDIRCMIYNYCYMTY